MCGKWGWLHGAELGHGWRSSFLCLREREARCMACKIMPPAADVMAKGMPARVDMTNVGAKEAVITRAGMEAQPAAVTPANVDKMWLCSCVRSRKGDMGDL